MRVGLLVMATGSYARFAAPLWDSAWRHFLPQAERKMIVFSDRRCDLPGAEWVRQPHSDWPGPTLRRYHAYLRARRRFASCDYVFCCDADMLFVDRVGEEALGDLVATAHPGFFASARTELPYERRPASRAFVSTEEGGRYFAGAFVGGRRERFVALARAVAAMVDDDEAAGMVAEWHDESYLNRYLASTPPTVVLSPAYCTPQTWSLPFPPRLLALDKVHASERQSIATGDGALPGRRQPRSAGRSGPAPRTSARGTGRSVARPTSRVSIAAVTVTDRPHLLSRVLAALAAQRRRPDAWLVFVHADGEGVDAFFNLEERARTAGIATTFARRRRELSRGCLRNEAMLRAEPFGIAAVVEDGDEYGPDYFALLAESVAAHPEADLFGIREHDVAFGPEIPAADGVLMHDRRRVEGGRVIADDRVTWCCPATLAVRCASWLRLGLRYEDVTGGEEEPLWQAAEAGELVLVRRPTVSFCGLERVRAGGLGGPSTNAGAAALEPRQSGDLQGAALVAAGAASSSGSPGLSIVVRRAGAGATGSTLPGLLVEDPELAPGTIQIRGPGGHVLQVIRLLPEALPCRTAGLEVVPVEGGYVVYDPGRDRVHFLNGTASVVLELCTGDNTLAQIADLLADVYGGALTEDGVRDAVHRLREEGLVEP